MSSPVDKRGSQKAPRPIELLAPAKDIETAICAIKHGADAVYIGPEGFGARSAAANSTEDIRRLCEYAHNYRVRVYATVNTLVLEHELKQVERLVYELWHAGTDALIVQDMGLLRLDLPPIALHASTQCDTRTPEKARFLQEVGFSQIVLARELTLEQIEAICREVTVPVEAFVHGALCVSYSGRCHASYALCGRSANRGRCAQICRLPYSLRDANGCRLAPDSHFLSLKDFNASQLLPHMLQSGVSSFKIEGRLKDKSYVKNITAYYRALIDAEIMRCPNLYVASSCGHTDIKFTPEPYKSFNRGFTHYFLENRKPASIASLRTPKSMGEPLHDRSQLKAGDGVSYFDVHGQYTGVRVNKMIGSNPVFARNIKLPKNVELYRTTDIEHSTLMERDDTSDRRIAVDIELFENRAVIADERGCRVVLPMPPHGNDAKKPMEPLRYFNKLGDTIYALRNFTNNLDIKSFFPASVLTALRRELVKALDVNATITYNKPLRAPENKQYPYPSQSLYFADNVANSKAQEFYKSHGVREIEAALETNEKYNDLKQGTVLMTTRHCILREIGMCKKTLASAGRKSLKEPLVIENTGGASFTLRFNCKECEMQVLKR